MWREDQYHLRSGEKWKGKREGIKKGKEGRGRKGEGGGGRHYSVGCSVAGGGEAGEPR